MNTNLDSISTNQIHQCVNLLKNILGDDLLGIYLYGSAVMGGLQKYSDIDLFVVSKRSTTLEEKQNIISKMLSISGIYQKTSKKPIELTLVVQSQIKPWTYPPIFDFQYGDWLRQKFEAGEIEPWETKEMPDLAIVITQIFIASEIIYGPDPKELIDQVPYKDFIKASTKEIDSLINDLEFDTRNVLLTLARIWATVETSKIFSKPKAAIWAIEKLPPKNALVIKRAHSICIGNEPDKWEDINDLIKPTAEFIVSKIKDQVEIISKRSFDNKMISVG